MPGTAIHTKETLAHVMHESFHSQDAASLYDFRLAPDLDVEQNVGYLPDEATRDLTRRMHYAGFRSNNAATHEEHEHWRQIYFELRDRIILGNRKLIFRAIHKSIHPSAVVDDLIGECDLVMIRVVAAYNPWLGIRFSTYAFTCLMRALARLMRKQIAHKVLQFLPLDAADEHSFQEEKAETPADFLPVQTYLEKDHPLLTDREKQVLQLRFGLADRPHKATLEMLGQDLGLSKERVRQLQLAALEKLRHALAGGV